MFAQGAGEAVVDEVEQRCRCIGDLVAKHRSRAGHQSTQIQRQVFFNQHADHAQRMAAQRERVFVTRGQVANAEHADQRFELVGQRHDHADRVARQLVAGKARLVVIFNCSGYFRTQAVV